MKSLKFRLTSVWRVLKYKSVIVVCFNEEESKALHRNEECECISTYININASVVKRIVKIEE